MIILATGMLIVIFGVGYGYYRFLGPKTAVPGQTAGLGWNFSASEIPQRGGDAGGSTYTNEVFGFSVVFPDGYKTTELEDDLGKTILVKGEGEKHEFQIFIMPFDEDGPISPERIREDIPEVIIEDPQNITLSGTAALLFWGSNESLGKTRELWFVHGGNLYQISSYAEFDAGLSKIMSTWKFK